MDKFTDIVRRSEETRLRLAMSKSRFCAEIGISPQTYNNFVGAQCTKPSVQLLYGIVARFGVDPLWLLTGQGCMFPAETPAQVAPASGEEGLPGPELAMVEARPPSAPLAKIVGLITKIEHEFANKRAQQARLLHRVDKALNSYLAQDPKGARMELAALLERIENRLNTRGRGENNHGEPGPNSTDRQETMWRKIRA